MTAKELSGVFTDTQKWIEAWDLLASKDCSVEHLRIYHNSPEQLEATAKALHGNTSIRTFEVGAAAGVGSQALAELLKVNLSVSSLTVQSIPADDVNVLASGLSCCNNSLKAITIHSLTAQEVAIFSAALTNSNSACALQQLRLPKCRLDAAAAAALHQALLSQPSLTVLSLQEACFENSSITSSTSRTATSPCPSLDTDNSSSTTTDSNTGSHGTTVSAALASPAYQLFTVALAAHPSLSHLDLSKATGIAADSSGLQQLGGYLAAATHLQELILSEAGLDKMAAEQLAAAMQQRSKSVAAAAQAVILASSEPISVAGNSLSAAQPVGCLACSGLRVLDMNGNKLGPAGAAALGRALGLCCSKLVVVRLSANELGSEGLAGLCAGLREGWCRLAELDVSGNKIKGSDGLTAFLDSPAAQHLATLNLANNCLNDAAASQLAAALTCSGSSSSNLACLDLSQNWIGDEGAKALAGMLQKHASLSHVQLQKNRIRRPGLDALVDATLANQLVQDLCLEGNWAVDRMSKMTLDDLARALAQRRRGLGSSRRSSAATAATVSDDGTDPGRGSSRRASDSALAAADRLQCDSEASDSICNSRRESAATCSCTAATAVAGVAYGDGGRRSTDVGFMLVDDDSLLAGAVVTLPSTSMEYNQDDIITPRASKVARLSDSSSTDGTAAAAGGSDSSFTAPVSPFATGSSAIAATLGPTILFQVPVGFADRLMQRRSYSFEYWCQQRAAQQVAVSSAGSGAPIQTIHLSSQQGTNFDEDSTANSSPCVVDGAVVAAANADGTLPAVEPSAVSATDVASNLIGNDVCTAECVGSSCPGDRAEFCSEQVLVDVFPASMLGVLDPVDIDRPVHLTDAKAASLSGWLLDDCCTASKIALPDLALGVVRRGSRQDSMGKGRAAAPRLDSVSECDSELLSLSPSEGNSGASVASLNAAMNGAAATGIFTSNSSTTSCDMLCQAVGPVVMLRGTRTSSGSAGGASGSSSRYASCSTSSSEGGGSDCCESSSCGSSRSGSPRAVVRHAVRRLGAGHLVVKGSVGGGGLSRFAKPAAGSAVPE